MANPTELVPTAKNHEEENIRMFVVQEYDKCGRWDGVTSRTENGAIQYRNEMKNAFPKNKWRIVKRELFETTTKL